MRDKKRCVKRNTDAPIKVGGSRFLENHCSIQRPRKGTKKNEKSLLNGDCSRQIASSFSMTKS